MSYDEFNPEDSDGCTFLSWVNKLFGRPPLKYRDCCIEHDRAYFYGGTRQDRKAADVALRKCVEEVTGKKVWPLLMYIAVRIFGHPRFPSALRWAYRASVVEGIIRGYSAGQD